MLGPLLSSMGGGRGGVCQEKEEKRMRTENCRMDKFYTLRCGRFM